MLKTLLVGSLIAALVGQPPAPAPITGPAPDGYQWETAVFPAYQVGRADYNAVIFETDPFTLTMLLPAGWTVEAPKEKQPLASVFTPLELYDGGEYAGYVGFNTFQLYPDTTPENFYRSVYPHLMLGSVVSWDCAYRPLVENENACTATCFVRQKDTSPEWWGRMPSAPVHYSPAILSYDKPMLVYVAFSFSEGAVTADEWITIAKSVSLAPA